MRDSLPDLHALALTLAPELRDADLRLLRHQPDWICPVGAEAWCVRGPHLGIRDHLRQIGEWSNRWGSYIVFVAEPSVALLIHELGHALPATPAIPDSFGEPSEAERGAQLGQLLAWSRGSRDGEPWRGHDLKFIRRAIHLHHRAEQAGVAVPLESLNVGGPAYALSMPENYRVELGSQPASMSRRSFAEIEAAQLPPRFVNRFLADVTEWHAEQLMEHHQ